MHLDSRAHQLFADVPPPGAALQRELATIGPALAQPAPQRRAGGRTDLTPMHQPVVVHIIERHLLSMHVEPAYHCHRDLLELLKPFTDAHIIERLSRGGPHHMSSFPTAHAPLVD